MNERLLRAVSQYAGPWCMEHVGEAQATTGEDHYAVAILTPRKARLEIDGDAIDLTSYEIDLRVVAFSESYRVCAEHAGAESIGSFAEIVKQAREVNALRCVPLVVMTDDGAAVMMLKRGEMAQA